MNFAVTYVEMSFLVGSVAATAIAAGTAGADVSFFATPFAGAITSIASGTTIMLFEDEIKEFTELNVARP